MKSLDVIERMRGACSIAAEILREAGALVAPGITTDEIDIAVHEAQARELHQLTRDRQHARRI